MALVRVKYKGLSTIREISKKDLEGTGVSIDRDLSWNPANRYTQDVEASDRFLEILKENDGFQVSKITDDGSASDDLVTASTDGGEEADVLVDGRTGDSTPTNR